MPIGEKLMKKLTRSLSRHELTTDSEALLISSVCLFLMKHSGNCQSTGSALSALPDDLVSVSSIHADVVDGKRPPRRRQQQHSTARMLGLRRGASAGHERTRNVRHSVCDERRRRFGFGDDCTAARSACKVIMGSVTAAGHIQC